VSLRRWLSWAGVLALVAVALLVGTRPEGSSNPDGRAAAIAASLRCPVCQGLSVADSDSETARSIRSDIDRRIAGGQSDAEIRQAYVDRYGEWILLRPRGRGLGAVVWLLPVVAVAAAAAGLVVAGRRWRRRWRRSATDEDRRLVIRALAGHADGTELAAGASANGEHAQMSPDHARRGTGRRRAPRNEPSTADPVRSGPEGDR
jgi:cytochrome c-type biogenesis protein CcmH/NrfF